jgi:predicted regulator of Ras-like GTPase activity (Roadblock/LC7/MglB family)
MILRDGISHIGSQDMAQLDGLLAGFLTETRANCVILVDRSGRLLASAGETGDMDRITFASLVAGDFAASDQLASLLGEPEFSSLYHQGENCSMFLADLGGWAILAALFDGRTTLGMVRVKSKAIVPRFTAVFAEVAARGPSKPLNEIQRGWTTDAEGEIDRLFSD